MSSYRATDMAEAQAIGLCYLARQKGLPDIHALRQAVAQLHPAECDWCAYPPAELLRMLDNRQDGDGHMGDPAGIPATEIKRWWALPSKVRMKALRLAQGGGES